MAVRRVAHAHTHKRKGSSEGEGEGIGEELLDGKAAEAAAKELRATREMVHYCFGAFWMGWGGVGRGGRVWLCAACGCPVA